MQNVKHIKLSRPASGDNTQGLHTNTTPRFQKAFQQCSGHDTSDLASILGSSGLHSCSPSLPLLRVVYLNGLDPQEDHRPSYPKASPNLLLYY